MKKILALALALLLVLGTLAGCAAKTEVAPAEAGAYAYNTKDYAAEAPMAAEPMMEEAKAEPEYAEESIATASYAGGGEEEPVAEDAPAADFAAKIIYSANLELQTTEFDKAVATLESMVSSMGGFIENSNVNGSVRRWDDGTTTIVDRYASYTVRIPAKDFETFLSQTNGLGNVLSTYRYAENVTSRYTDYEARLSSLRTQEERLLDLLEKAEDVDSLIALESRLTDVRYETESIERNLRNLDMQIGYSTVYLNIQEVEIYTPTVPVQRTFGEKLSDAFSDGWNSFTWGFQRFILDLVESLPGIILFLAIVAALFFIVRAIVRKRKARKQKQTEEDARIRAEWEARGRAEQEEKKTENP